MAVIPATQCAIQLVGPDKLTLNRQKEVHKVGPYQILARVEAVGLCFSDLKLLKQFDQHARKSEVLSGVDKTILPEIPSYCPGTAPTVPGHETVCTIVAVGQKVSHHKVGQRVLVQTDYRWLKTAASNAAFGYNFEGALQQYVLIDERVIVEPESGESLLLPADPRLSASAIALVEPWACVECSYVTKERQTVLAGGRLLVVADSRRDVTSLAGCFKSVKSGTVTAICGDNGQLDAVKKIFPAAVVSELNQLAPNAVFDDIIYFGSNKDTLDILNDKLAAAGIINIVLDGREIGKPVNVGVGRVHYGNTRWIGTLGSNAAESYLTIPAFGEIRDNDKVLVIGAAGPMGQMHVIRLVCEDKKNVSVTGTDFDDSRLASLDKKARPFAEANKVELRLINPQKTPDQGKYSYCAIMAPVGALVAQAVRDSIPGTLINIFAGIPANVKQELDLDTYIANRCFMLGTSGSRLSDMKRVLEKVTSGRLNTDVSVDAVSGMAGATDGLAAVENRTMAGKIIVYPALVDMPLVTLSKMADHCPNVAAKLNEGIWTKQAEQELLKQTQK
ncbi:MAG: alcohol dehydrogenase catalytic domain-containing protein [Anaerohalosphaeraceae bacterium]